LSTLSPPTIAFRLAGAPACANTARVATGSVEEIMLPYDNALGALSGSDKSK